MSNPVPQLVEGDLVRAGGRLMVVAFAVESLFLCEWTDGAGREHRETFAANQLERVDTSTPLWIHAVSRLRQRWSVVALRLN